MKTKIMALVGAASLLGITAHADQMSDTDKNQMERDHADNGVQQLGDLKKANKIVGCEIKDAQGNRVGKVKDLAIDLKNGRILEVIIAKGGILGVDEKYTAVPPAALTWDTSTKTLRLNADQNQFRDSADFKYNNWNEATDVSPVREVYQRYGIEPYFVQDQSGHWTTNGTPWNAGDKSVNHGLGTNETTAEVSNANADDKRGQASRYYAFNGENAGASNYFYGNSNNMGNHMASNDRDHGSNSNWSSGTNQWHRRQEQVGYVARSSKIIGSTAYNNQNEKLGKVQNLVIDLPAGRVVEVVIASGGFMGVDNELSAVPPQSFSWNTANNELTLDTTRDALKAAPHFKANDMSSVNDNQHISDVYNNYHVQPYFNDNGADNTAQNVRDRNNDTMTPMKQGGSQSDRQVTAQIRRAIVADSSASTNEKNVKIMTVNGQVTLRGVVNSEDEKRSVADAAAKVAGADKVDNQLEVRANSSSATDTTK